MLAWLWLRRDVAVLPGEVIYRDAAGAPTLVSHRYRLAGRPDYITQDARGVVPVEVKSYGIRLIRADDATVSKGGRSVPPNRSAGSGIRWR